ncbi:WD40-repeat-containing domain protein [Helicostylum pulchrum]|nr:WD40-repeat-containing domain protein [Helicostylum pulchrum]
MPESLVKINHGPFPTELLVSIFIYLDGFTLSSCTQVCQQWNLVISQFDAVIWPNACHRDFESSNARKFWSPQFPKPCSKLTWQDMYRTTRNWYTGHVKGFYPKVAKNSTLDPCTVIGAPQEQGLFTQLTLAQDGRIVRSNPNYHSPTGQSLVIQSPRTKQSFFLNAAVSDELNWPEDAQAHAVVCHFTHPSSKWLVTGGLNGTVAVWDLNTKRLIRMWHGHRGRVLCISMNDEAVVSGGSDNMIRVWDWDKDTNEWASHSRPTRRGMINTADYLSSRSDWYQGVGEIAVNGNLVACAPDASGPVLVFSLLTGSIVYELSITELAQTEWATEDITAFTKLCLTPFFLLTKGKVNHQHKSKVPLVPSKDNVVVQRTFKKQTGVGYVAKLSDSKTNQVSPPAAASMTTYQLYQYYQSLNSSNESVNSFVPTTSACINVWNLATGEIIYRLVPMLDQPYQNYTITDIKVTPDFSKVFATIEVRGQKQYDERVFCWDFALKSEGEEAVQDFDIVELDHNDPVLRKTGTSWVCFM